MVQIDIAVKVIGDRDMVDRDIMIRAVDKDIWTLLVTATKVTVAKVMTGRVTGGKATVAKVMTGRMEVGVLWRGDVAGGGFGRKPPDKITVDKITVDKITPRRNTRALQMDKDTVTKNIGTKVTRDKVTTATRMWRKVIIIPQRNGTATQTADAQAQPPMDSSGKIVKAAKMLKQNVLTRGGVHR